MLCCCSLLSPVPPTTGTPSLPASESGTLLPSHLVTHPSAHREVKATHHVTKKQTKNLVSSRANTPNSNESKIWG